MPFVLQFNKSDLPNTTNFDILQQRLNFYRAPQFKSVATKGIGVFETLKMIINQVVNHIQSHA